MHSDFLDKKLIEDLADLLDKTGLGEIELAKGDFSVRVAKPKTHASPMAVPASAPLVSPEPAPADNKNALLSPMVGNAYLSPRPGADAFIKVGDQVKTGQTLLIVEAMKVMNPIPSPRDGVVTKIMVADAQPVEYDEPLIVIE